MKIEEIRQRSSGELTNLVAQLGDDLYKLRVKKTTNQLEDTSVLRQMRRDIARAKTVVRGRELGREKFEQKGQK